MLRFHKSRNNRSVQEENDRFVETCPEQLATTGVLREIADKSRDLRERSEAVAREPSILEHASASHQSVLDIGIPASSVSAPRVATRRPKQRSQHAADEPYHGPYASKPKSVSH